MSRLKDKVVVVTGASSGIGRATANAFAEKGATVALNARRSAALEEVADECRRRGADADVFAADVTDADAVDEIAREVAGRYGRLDVWVNNAGVNLFGRLDDSPVEAWHRVVETNVFGTYHGIRAALPWMREQGQGVIVNVSSLLGKVSSPFMSSYVVSKQAVRALSESVRQEVLDVPGIHVCVVLPGPVDTPLFASGGNYMGLRVKPLAPVVSADRVASAVLSCARRPRSEVVVGKSTALALLGSRVAPGLAERISARQVGKDHFGTTPVPPSSGNIFEPSSGDATVSGGWTPTADHVGPRDPRSASADGRGPARRLLTVGAVLAAGAGVAEIVRRRRA
ncbi:SDR family oxidoreductase [Phytoactinopolyspora mesophila]|uniref:SDR family oxidoreductase n=1 Tax=Phytoactinopolyspora mesophila TaxID=2650750 RepID=UPI0013908FAF